MVVLALCAGTCSFLTGLFLLFALAALEGDEHERLFQLNTILGSAIVLVAFGTFLVYQAASSLGTTPSRPMSWHVPWYLLLAFPVLVGAGQWLVLNPGMAPWLFPFVNIAIVAIPSLLIATVCLRRYGSANRLSWPVTWREWTGAFSYGAIGAVIFAGILNTGYFIGAGWLVLRWNDIDTGLDITRGLPALPRETGILFDLSVLSLMAPLNEEFLKGLIVALFWWRGGSAARCFAWGVLAGTGFNLVETFLNSLEIVDASVTSRDEHAEQWWIFGIARAGAGAMHGIAAGFAALAFYGLLRRRWLYLLGYPVAVLLHANWNAAVYLMAGDSILSRSGPSSEVLTLLGLGVLVALSLVSVLLLWVMSGKLRDTEPASIYRAVGMMPAAVPWQHRMTALMQSRTKPIHPA